MCVAMDTNQLTRFMSICGISFPSLPFFNIACEKHQNLIVFLDCTLYMWTKQEKLRKSMEINTIHCFYCQTYFVFLQVQFHILKKTAEE